MFTDEFKAEAVRMVLDQGLSVSEAARRLGIHSTLLTKWKKRLEKSSKPRPNAPTALEEENRRLRAENERLRMEREILKKATAFFAKESK
jgi:transposase